MKRINFLLALFTITMFSFSLCSCSDSDDNDSDDSASTIVGTWLTTKETSTNISTGESKTYSYVGLGYIFYQDGTGIEIHDDYSLNIKWSVSGNSLIINDDGMIDIYTYSLDGSTLWTEFEEEGYIYRTYYEQNLEEIEFPPLIR